MKGPGIILFVFVCIGKGLACNPEWTENNGKCYRISAFRYDIRMARRYCQIYGGDLAVVDSNPTFSILRNLEHYEMYDYWVNENSTIIGSGSHPSTELPNSCPYVTGEEFLFSSCEEKRHFICEVKQNTKLTCPKNWHLYGRTCYKPMPDNYTYEEAVDSCTHRGSLAILDDIDKEHQVSAAILGRNTTFLVGAKATNGTILWRNGKQFLPSCSQCFVAHSTGECLGFQSSSEHPVRFSWVHLDCDSRNKYLCEMSPTQEPTKPPPTNLPSLECPHGFNWKVHETSRFCYWQTRSETERLNWFQARKFCQNFGGDLATYQDESQELAGEGGAKGLYKGLWFGLKRNSDNVFTWVDGSPLNYTNWNYKEPKLESDSKFCVVHGADESKWELDYCGVRRWFVCKAPKIRRVTYPDSTTPYKNDISGEEPVSETQKSCPDSSNWVDLGSDMCYIFEEDVRMSWIEAAKYCVKHGAHLASFHSEKEESLVRKYLKHNLYSAYFFIGLMQYHDGNFSWVDGSPLSFTNWDPDRNSSSPLSNACVKISAISGVWIPTNCTIKTRGIICSVSKISVPFLEASSNNFLKHEKQDDITNKLTVGGIFGSMICLLAVVIMLAVAALYICPSTRVRAPVVESYSL